MSLASTQLFTVSGTIVDGENGDPLMDAIVSKNGTTDAISSTGMDGTYLIFCKAGSSS